MRKQIRVHWRIRRPLCELVPWIALICGTCCVSVQAVTAIEFRNLPAVPGEGLGLAPKTNEIEDIDMHQHGLTIAMIMLLILVAGPVRAQGMDCQQQKQQLEEAMRMMGNLSEEEMQSRLDEVQQICDTHGANPANATPSTRQEPAQSDDLPMTELTAEYLAGKWCGVTGKQERGPWEFSANGSYQVGIAAGNSYTMRPGGDSIEHFHNRFDRLSSRSADQFVVHRFHHETVFQRGGCE